MKVNYVGCARPKHVARQLFAELCSPVSLDLLVSIDDRFENFSALMQIDYKQYIQPREAAIDALAVCFLKKNSQLSSEQRKERTRDLFLENELKCRETNHRLLQSDLMNPWCEHLSLFQSKIASILGSVPLQFEFGFGPGVSVGCKGDDTQAYTKYRVPEPSVTSAASSFARLYLKGTLWETYLKRDFDQKVKFNIVDTAEIAFVPKNFKFDRIIAIEPLLNTYFQKGIGNHIRKRLKKFGVDLRSQSFNQEGAYRAQADSLATVDFSSASDNIAYQVVLQNLPIDWAHILDTFRTPCVKIDGTLTVLEKFSSMGNGYTFELESMLFFAAAHAVVKKGTGRLDDILVYGDDVILPKDDYPAFVEFTQYLGFSVSSEKSFIDGSFFESCGVDIYDGCNIRPFYLKNELTNWNDIFNCHNSLFSFSERWKVDLSGTLALIKSYIPESSHLYVPFPYDGGFWTSITRDANITDEGWEGSVCKRYVFQPSKADNIYFEPSILHSLNSPSNGTREYRKRGRLRVVESFLPAIS